MSYQCFFCKKTPEAKTPCVKVVMARHQMEHPFRSKVGMHWEFNEKKQKWMWVPYDDPGGCGMQISHEVKSCPECAFEYQRKQEKQQKYQAMTG